MIMPASAWSADKHPRGQHGKFLGRDHGGGPSMTQPPKITVATPVRSLTRGESWQRTGSKIAEIPKDYTGSHERELPVGSFTRHDWTPQVPAHDPKAREDHHRLMRSLVHVIQSNKPGTISRAEEQGLIPQGTPRRTVLRAYHHASMLGLHDFGVGKYHFAMDDHLKEEMTPLVPFMRYARRRVKSTMLGTERGAWRPYRSEFGEFFPKPKYDKITGAERKRVSPNDVLVKATMPGIGIPGLPKQPRAGVLQAAPGLSRFARYRAYIAHNEAAGMHQLKPLTQAEHLQRVKAAKTWHLKVASGAPRLQPGMPGSIAGQGLKRRYSFGAK